MVYLTGEIGVMKQYGVNLSSGQFLDTNEKLMDFMRKLGETKGELCLALCARQIGSRHLAFLQSIEKLASEKKVKISFILLSEQFDIHMFLDVNKRAGWRYLRPQEMPEWSRLIVDDQWRRGQWRRFARTSSRSVGEMQAWKTEGAFDEIQPGIIQDFSTQGARLRISEELKPVSEKVLLSYMSEHGTIKMLCQVKWTKPATGEVGLQFIAQC